MPLNFAERQMITLAGEGIAKEETLRMKMLIAACCTAGLLFAQAVTAQQADHKKGPRHLKKPKVEQLACRLGTEDEHARIAVVLLDGRVNSFAYYSKWKPRTCSMDVRRGDAYSKWEDTGDVTVVTLIEDKGAFLIDHEPNRYHFIFREIDRMRYCGMEGKVSGSLTIFRGQPQCELEGVMERDGDANRKDKIVALPPQPAKSADASKE
jgi:hypothetical protein